MTKKTTVSRCNGVRGWFPSNYVQIIDDYEQEDDTAEHRGSLADPRLHREEASR